MGVVVIGQIGRDLVLRTDGPPSAGEATTVLQRDELLGGKGANQAVGLAQLGVPVALIGAVGDDSPGRSRPGRARFVRAAPYPLISVSMQLPYPIFGAAIT